jgi:hypothetical protein
MLIPITEIAEAEASPRDVGALIVGLSGAEQAELFCALGYQATIVSWWSQQCTLMADCMGDRHDLANLINVLEVMIDALITKQERLEVMKNETI